MKSDSSWRCFHCDEVFTDKVQAHLHFGDVGYYGAYGTPACQVDAKYLRDLENQLHSYRNEDTELHKQIRCMESEHSTALRRAEESGYAKGLKDYTTLEAERDTLKARCEKLEGYARHLPSCRKNHLILPVHEVECTCGLDELQKQGEADT